MSYAVDSRPSGDQHPAVSRLTCAELPDLSEADLMRLAAHWSGDVISPADTARLSPLAQMEIAPVPDRDAAADRLRVCFWNIERGHRPEAIAGALRATGADISLLCELDNGISRTGHRHVTRDIAEDLGHSYLYAVEFIEPERFASGAPPRARAGQGRPGYHGNAIFARQHLEDPALIRLPGDGGWFSESRAGRRVGGRIAIATTLRLGGQPVLFVCTHLESHAQPAERALQMRVLLEEIDELAGDRPVLLGGDFNTRTMSKNDIRDPALRHRRYREEPARFTNPEGHEPLFEIAAAAGYDWRGCNLPTPTERAPAGEPDLPRFRLDWFFARGLVCENPTNLPAETGAGVPLSDHDAITLDIRLPDAVR